MNRAAMETYAPINTIKAVADGLWIVDGPLISFGFGGLSAPFTTRMTIVRLIGGRLFIHSPTPLTEQLKQDVIALGSPRWLIAPNRLHYSWIGNWKHAFHNATAYLAPRVVEQARGRIDFDHVQLADGDVYPWGDEIATLPIAGRYMTEFVFFHYPTRTLIVTDLIENFEPAKLHSWLLRTLTRLGGVQDPHGAMPRDMRLSFPRPQLRAAVETMISWNPERIILAHGRCYTQGGADELRRAFHWLLKSS